MRKFECACGSREFYANPKTNMVQCTGCRQRFMWEGSWVKFDVVKNFKKQASEFVNARIKYVKVFVEDPVQFVKKHWVKKKKVPQKEFLLDNKEDHEKAQKVLQKMKIMKRWKSLIKQLEEKKVMAFGKNDHYGSVRGKAIVLEAHKDLNKIGIKTRINLKGNKARLELV